MVNKIGIRTFLQEQTMKPIEELTFTDDFMFGHIMQNKEICKELLERL